MVTVPVVDCAEHVTAAMISEVMSSIVFVIRRGIEGSFEEG